MTNLVRCAVIGMAAVFLGTWPVQGGPGASRIETHVPPLNEPLLYDGALVPGVAQSGRLGWGVPQPDDGYDWYCFEAVAGQLLVIDAVRTSGDLLLNLGILQGIGNDGDPRSTLIELISTSNASTPDVQLLHVPSFSGPVTIFVSTWLLELDGTYEVAMTGGLASPICAPVLAVEFDRVGARRIGSAVAIEWSTTYEDGVIGFRILGAGEPTMAEATVAVDWVESSGSLTGGSYRALDALAGDGAGRSYYQVQEITTSGFGAVSPVVSVADANPDDGPSGGRERGRSVRR